MKEGRQRGDEKEGEGVGGWGEYACHHNYQQVDTNKGRTSVQSSRV